MPTHMDRTENPTDNIRAAAERLLDDVEKARPFGFDYDAEDMVDIKIVARAALSMEAKVERLRAAMAQALDNLGRRDELSAIDCLSGALAE